MKRRNSKWIWIAIGILIFFIIVNNNEKIPEHKLIYGIAVHPSHYDTLPDTRGLDTLKQLGVSMVREDVTWQGTESTKGVYNFQNSDRRIELLRNKGIETLPILTYGNVLYANMPIGQNWETIRYTPPIGSPEWETYKKAFAEFIYQSVKHFSEKYNLTYYEIWNEPYGFWSPDSESLEIRAIKYTELMKLAYPRAKQANPKAQILIGGLGTTFQTDDYTAVAYRYGIKDYFDIMNIHPYEYTYTANLTAQRINLDKLENLMKYFGDDKKRWWVTEVGVPSAGAGIISTRDTNGNIVSINFDGQQPNWLNEQHQADAVNSFFELIKKYPKIDAVFWYDFKEDYLVRGDKNPIGCPKDFVSITCPVYNEGKYGIVNTTYGLKPAFYAYQNIISEGK